MTDVILKQILAMLVIMVIGMICAKTRLVTEKGNKELSNLLLMVVNPLMIFMAYEKDFTVELVRNLLASFVLSVLSFVITIVLSHFLISKKHSEAEVERFAAIYSNCGFFGIPLVNAALGMEGVFYLTAYLTTFNLMVWTHGVLLMEKGRRLSASQVLKNLLNVNIIAVVLGLCFFVFQIRLEENLRAGLKYVADMNTPLAMLIAGINLTQVKPGRILKEKGFYLVSILRLIAYPLLMIILFRFIPAEPVVKQTILIASACPTGATVTLFALRYNKNAPYASALYALNTVLALITMPLVLALI